MIGLWKIISLRMFRKTENSLFHKPRNHYFILYYYTTFLGVLLDGNLSWSKHLKCTENKVAKSVGLMYKARPFLD